MPFVDHRYGRAALLDEPVVAVSLYELVNMATGKVHVASRAELAARFLIPEGAQVVVSGVDKDGPIERWWELKDRRSILAALKDLGIALITTPNYSVLTDVPRTDNLHAMKRILLAWTEMASAGLATALHVNGADRTRLCPLGRVDRRTGRRSKFWRSSSRQAAAAASASTGMSRSSARWPIASGVRWRSSFVAADASSTRCSEHFAQVSLVETEAFARTIRRRKAYLTEAGRLKWAKFATPVGAPIDDLFAHNVSLVRSSYEMPRHAAVASRPRPRLPRCTADGDGEPIQPGLLRELDLTGEARGVAPQPQGVVATAKS